MWGCSERSVAAAGRRQRARTSKFGSPGGILNAAVETPRVSSGFVISASGGANQSAIDVAESAALPFGW